MDLLFGFVFSFIFLFFTTIAFGFTGNVGGTSSSRILKELDSNTSEDDVKYIIKRSRLGFILGSFLGSILYLGGVMTLAVNVISDLDLDWGWPMYIAAGFALMGAIGATFTTLALFRTINVDQP